MENYWEENKTLMEDKEPLLKSNDKKGGLRTLPFIIGSEAFEKMATYGLMPNMTLYLMGQYHMEMTSASNLLFMWSAATNFMPLFGAIIADSLLGRFYTIGFGTIICLMGMVLLWSTTLIPQVGSTTIFPFLLLCTSFGLISIGAGGIRSSSLAFGANQLENGEFQKTPSLKESYFGWYYASYTFSVLIALTCVVYIQDSMGWGVGFAVPAVLMLFLNKACSFRDPQKNLNLGGGANDPWSLCTVDQVEELKALLRVIPIWFSGMIMSINLCQTSFPVLQADSLNRHITSKFSIPAASFSTFTVISIILWIIIYDRVFLPVASRMMGRPIRLSTRTRMGIGIFLSFLAMTVTSVVESIRRGLANQGYLGLPEHNVTISAMWLVPQYCLMGFAEASNAIAQNEFYFSEFPRSMSSIASTLLGIGLFLANLIASLIMNSVDKISKDGGHESWISSDINKGRYDYYYLILAGLSMGNMIYFLICSNVYGSFKEDEKVVEQEDVC